MTFFDPYSQITDLTERNICDELGVEPTNIKEFRKKDLTDGKDYVYGKYNAVTYTPQGFEKLLIYCGLRQQHTDTQPIEAIVSAFPANRNMLIARLEDGREVRVRIKAIHNLRQGMKITIQRDPAGLFELRSPYPNPSKFVTVIRG